MKIEYRKVYIADSELLIDIDRYSINENWKIVLLESKIYIDIRKLMC